MTATVIAFIIVFVLAIVFFAYSCYRRFGLVLKGRPDNRFNAFFTLACIFDIMSVLALLAVILAMIRRLTFPPPYTEARSRDAFIILSLVAGLMIAFFGMNAIET